jgi:hypothetical protein
MTEGWNGDDYLMLFSGEEAQSASERYGIAALLPGYRIVGLHFWDDFIVQDENGDTFTLPAVPCDSAELARFQVPPADELVPDDRFAGKVKWYLKPIKFGGDPRASENTTWVTLAEHADFVRWWNDLYRDLTAGRSPAK